MSDCHVVKAAGDGLYDLISQSDNFDAYSMASIPEFTTTTPRRADKMHVYTPSGKSQLKLKMMQNAFADDSMSMASAPDFSPCSSDNSKNNSAKGREGDESFVNSTPGKALNEDGKPILNMSKVRKVDDTIVVPENDYEDDTRSADSFKEKVINTNLIIDKTRQSFGKNQRRPALDADCQAAQQSTQVEAQASDGQ